MEIDRNGLEVLDRAECFRLLGSCHLGRLGVSVGALPTILPVNYWFDGRSIFVRTSAGSKLDAALQGTVVAFEVDDADAIEHAGWSVVVTGVASAVSDASELERMRRAPLPHWAPDPGNHVIAISTEMVSGRRLRDLPLGPTR
jgi:nitroimidazol reductase NimA-like FMN-containing flavoprotein (pyridoxamine 5'-phosphate oxidase superfamily)